MMLATKYRTLLMDRALVMVLLSSVGASSNGTYALSLEELLGGNASVGILFGVNNTGDILIGGNSTDEPLGRNETVDALIGANSTEEPLSGNTTVDAFTNSTGDEAIAITPIDNANTTNSSINSDDLSIDVDFGHGAQHSITVTQYTFESTSFMWQTRRRRLRRRRN